mgnify:CR=1 FL=1
MGRTDRVTPGAEVGGCVRWGGPIGRPWPGGGGCVRWGGPIGRPLAQWSRDASDGGPIVRPLAQRSGDASDEADGSSDPWRRGRGMRPMGRTDRATPGAEVGGCVRWGGPIGRPLAQRSGDASVGSDGSSDPGAESGDASDGRTDRATLGAGVGGCVRWADRSGDPWRRGRGMRPMGRTDRATLGAEVGGCVLWVERIERPLVQKSGDASAGRTDRATPGAGGGGCVRWADRSGDSWRRGRGMRPTGRTDRATPGGGARDGVAASIGPDAATPSARPRLILPRTARTTPPWPVRSATWRGRERRRRLPGLGSSRGPRTRRVRST